MDNERGDLMAILIRMQEKAIDAQERHERQRQKTSHGLQFVLRGVAVRRMLLSGADRCLERWKESRELVEHMPGFEAAEAQVETVVAGLKIAASAIVDDAHRFELGMSEVCYLASVERGEVVGHIPIAGHPASSAVLRPSVVEGVATPAKTAEEAFAPAPSTKGSVCMTSVKGKSLRSKKKK